MSSSNITINSTIQFNNGSSIPAFGLGTWRSDKGKVESIVKSAVLNGYKHVDCAWVYANEDEVGRGIESALKESNGKIKREDLFITSKLWNTHHSAENARKCLKQSLEHLKLDYLDLYLIHWPIGWKCGYDNWAINPETKQREFDDSVDLKSTWKVMEEFVKEGLVKSIGISNFNIQQIEEILSIATIKPVNNQVEVHPYFNQFELKEALAKHNITITSYCPLGNLGRPEGDKYYGVTPLKDEVIVNLGKKHNKSPAQIIIRWHLQCGFIVIPKTVTDERLLENANVFDFNLNQEEMNSINQLGNKNLRFVNPDFMRNGGTVFPKQE